MTDHEQRLAKLQKQFHGLRIMGGEGVTVHGSPTRGYSVEVKAGTAQSGATSGGGGEDATGACCADDGTCTITTEADCIGTYLGDDTVCDPNPCCPSQLQVVLSDITICPCVEDRSYDFVINDTYELNLDSASEFGCLWTAGFFAIGTYSVYPPDSCEGVPETADLDTELVVEFIRSTGEWLIHYEDQARSAIFFESTAMDISDTFNNDNTICGDPATQFAFPAVQTGTGGTAVITIL